MTMIAGIVSRDPRVAVPASVADILSRSISRNEGDESRVFQDARTFFVKVDIGAFGEPAEIVDKAGALTLIAGEPLLTANAEQQWQNRDADARSMHDVFVRGDLSALQRANGVFSAIHYNPAKGELSLIADKLGIRPLYYYISAEFVIFASALRILEDVAAIPKIMDVRAVTEMVGLGYALADRTPYVNIRLLRAAEIVRLTDKTVTRENYWYWDQIEASDLSGDELFSELYRRFSNAVARRIRNDTATAAYLSGGLDSRCIVAALRDRDVAVHTFNFGRPDTQDQIFGREFAAAVGTIHEEAPKKTGDLVPDYSSLMADGWRDSSRRNEPRAERPNIVWSGEGGSVALGHVHLTEKIVELMRAGEIDAVIEEHLARESAQVSPRLFRKDISARMSRLINNGIREELGKLKSNDPARSFYIQLLSNDQHRKLAKHFENIDLHRLEFQLPFFDSSLLELIVSMPIDICLRHRLYVKWLSLFPPAVTSVPWQVYPGHERCPVPVPEGLEYQWAKKYQAVEHKSRMRHVAEQSAELFGGDYFPEAVLNKRNLRIASWIHGSGLRDYQYLIGPAHTFYSYSKKCGGRYELPI